MYNCGTIIGYEFNKLWYKHLGSNQHHSCWTSTRNTKYCRPSGARLGGAAESDHVTPFLRELEWLNTNLQCECETPTQPYWEMNHDLSDWLAAAVLKTTQPPRHYQADWTPACSPWGNTCPATTTSLQAATASRWNSLALVHDASLHSSLSHHVSKNFFLIYNFPCNIYNCM